MWIYPLIGTVAVASALSLFFSSLTYALRELSRTELADYLGRHNADHWFEPLTDYAADLVFLTAVGRQLCNAVIFMATFAAFENLAANVWLRYLGSLLVVSVIAIFMSLIIPQAIARYAATPLVGCCAPLLHVLRKVLSPMTHLMHGADDVVRRAMGAADQQPEQQVEAEIMSAVEEGEHQGVVDEQEREMIESVIEFRDTTAGQIMTERTELAALSIAATLQDCKRHVEESGHSRIPVYDASLDHIVGILYARDLIHHLAPADEKFELTKVMRPPFFVPESKPLRDLLSDFRLQKVHMAVVLDEYGGTAGLVTIEDILEELVGEIADEHETAVPAMLKRIDDHIAEADARIRIEELNRMMGLNLPEDAGYETLGGFISTMLARIPEKGTVHEAGGVRYTVLDAEPQRIKRVKIELLSQPLAEVK